MPPTTIYKLERSSETFLCSIDLTIRNCETGNVVIHDHRFLPDVFEEDDDGKNISGNYTLPEEDLQEIIEIIHSGNKIFNRKKLEESEYVVFDGESNNIYFNDLEGHEVKFSEDNFFYEYEGISHDTKAGEVIRICSEIEEVLNRNGLSILNIKL